MANLAIDGPDLVVTLSPIEKLGALSRGPRVAVSRIARVRQTDEPYRELRGLRVGTGIPYVIVLGRMVYPGGKDFVAIYGRRPTTIVELVPGERYRRIMISNADPRVVEALRSLSAA